ncbi:hypothetical protein NC651_037562 [Populus alba x Populus x berolinensis]|nr:hypothetical protein NC651_037562 [Populus alba x Populus x berolinensis]
MILGRSRPVTNVGRSRPVTNVGRSRPVTNVGRSRPEARRKQKKKMQRGRGCAPGVEATVGGAAVSWPRGRRRCAAPTYLPAHYFETKDPSGKVREFNLIDGGVAANNPTLVAIREVSKAINRESPDSFRMNPMEYGRFLVLSLGTGTEKSEGKYDADEAAKWGIIGWLTSDHSSPLVDVFTQASGDMVDFHISTVFQSLNSEENYLRIQDDTLTGTLSSVDVATKENLENLVKVGEKLLEKPVSRVNLATGVFEPINKMTNEEALTKLAKLLSREKQLREVSVKIDVLLPVVRISSYFSFSFVYCFFCITVPVLKAVMLHVQDS